LGTIPFSLFTYYCSLYTDFCICFLSFSYGVSDIFMSAFQMELNDYPIFDLAEDGRLCSTGQHCLGFLRVLYDARIRLGYDGDALIYHCRLSMAHDMDQCEVSMTIPFNPMEPWSGSINDSEPDIDVDLMAHIALTSLCEDRLAATAVLPIVLLLIRNQENPVWQQRLEAVFDLKGPHFHVRMTLLAKYVQYMINLQHNTTVEEILTGEEVLVGTFFLNEHPVIILFDSGASHDFISSTCAKKAMLSMVATKAPYVISTPGGWLDADRIVRKAPLELVRKVFSTDLIILKGQGIDVILRMSWMKLHIAVLDIASRLVHLDSPVFGKVILHLPAVSHIKVSLHHVVELKLEGIHVIQEFPDVFPDDLLRMPP
jgi:hypothetical protein